MILSFRGFGETATPAQIRAKLQSEVSRIATFIAQQKLSLASTKANPLNYILETQRDAMTRAQNTITQNEHVLQQLKDTLEAAVTGGPEKLQKWINLASIVGDAYDLQAWKNKLAWTSTANMVTTVAKDSVQDIKEGAEKAVSRTLNTGIFIVGLGVLAYSITRGLRQ